MLNHYLIRVKTVYFATMRFFAFIMASLVMALSILPCADAANEKKANNSQSSLVLHQDYKNDQKKKDNCTPFCTCSCCSFSSYFSPLSKSQGTKIFQAEKYSFYDVAFNAEVHYSIWQPPKLS